jgi:YD repeat-containing protein
MNRLLLFITLLIAVSVSGCLDHKIPSISPGLTTPRLRVKKLTIDMANNQSNVSTFQYDNQGRLSSIVSYQTPDSSVADVLRGFYSYDDQNRLTQFRRVSKAGLSEGYIYSYNASGQVSQISHSGGLTWNYKYTETNQLTTAGLFFSHPRFSIRGALTFTFTGNNLTQTTGRTGISYQGMPDGMSTDFPGVTGATYTHDDKLNPFYGVFVIPSPFTGFTNVLLSPSTPGALFGGIDNVLTLSQNNVLTETPVFGSLGTITYQYEYNAANLPTVRIKTTTTPPPNAGVTVETLRFEYESY